MNEPFGAQSIADRLSEPRRDRLVAMLRDEDLNGIVDARWIPAGASQWKMAEAMRDDGLVFARNLGFLLTPLGAAVARIFEQRNKS